MRKKKNTAFSIWKSSSCRSCSDLQTSHCEPQTLWEKQKRSWERTQASYKNSVRPITVSMPVNQKRKWINRALSAVLMCGAYLTSYGNNFGAFSMFWSQWKRKCFHQNSFPHGTQNFSHNQFWRSVLGITFFLSDRTSEKEKSCLGVKK